MYLYDWFGSRVMVFNVAFNNISIISWRSVLSVEHLWFEVKYYYFSWWNFVILPFTWFYNINVIWYGPNQDWISFNTWLMSFVISWNMPIGVLAHTDFKRMIRLSNLLTMSGPGEITPETRRLPLVRYLLFIYPNTLSCNYISISTKSKRVCYVW